MVPFDDQAPKHPLDEAFGVDRQGKSMTANSTAPVGHEKVFAIEGDTIVFHNLSDVGTASGEVAHPLVCPGGPFQQPNEPGDLRRPPSLEDVCLRAQRAAIETLRLFNRS